MLIHQHLHDDVQQLALQRNRFPQLSDTDFRFFLQQIEGRQRTAHKLPTMATFTDWWYPVRLSCEQCSSEATASYKASLLRQALLNEGRESDCTLFDLTAGYGVDTYFMSAHVQEAHYVERNAELCAIAQHNFALHRPHIQVHNTTAEDFLASLPIPHPSELPPPSSPYRIIFLDPARRSLSGSKVFRIEDCEPNILKLLPSLRAKSDRIMIKFSPMLDITAALRAMGQDWDTHVVAVNNEVKEVLFLTGTGMMHAVNIHTREMRTDRFFFSPADEHQAQLTIAADIQQYIYEPNAAIIKAGAFRLVGEQYELKKLDTNTHLYTSDTCMSGFPGRVWEVIDAEVKEPKHQLDKSVRYSIISRNSPLSPEEIRKKYKLKDGDDRYLLAARHQGNPKLILGRRITAETR